MSLWKVSKASPAALVTLRYPGCGIAPSLGIGIIAATGKTLRKISIKGTWVPIAIRVESRVLAWDASFWTKTAYFGHWVP